MIVHSPLPSRFTSLWHRCAGSGAGIRVRPPWGSPGPALAALGLAFTAVGVQAADIDIRMLDSSDNGQLSFDPIFVQAQLGDTLVFHPASKGHTTKSLLVPDGAKAWKGGYDQQVRVTLEQEGIYLYGCEAHLRMGMVGMVQVGMPVNLDAATEAASAVGAQFVMNKGRFTSALAQVH